MDNNIFGNNPSLANISPEKLQFLMNFAGSKKPADMKDMMPFLLATMKSAKSKNIEFTESETDLLVSVLKQNMSPEEAEKTDKIMKLMRQRKSG